MPKGCYRKHQFRRSQLNGGFWRLASFRRLDRMAASHPKPKQAVRFWLPHSVLNSLVSARLTGGPFAEQPPDAEYDGKSVEGCGTASSSAKRKHGTSHEANLARGRQTAEISSAPSLSQRRPARQPLELGLSQGRWSSCGLYKCFFLAEAMPSIWRSRLMAVSNSAKTPSI